ncbi:MAG: hypothetical protein NVSMB21_07810 [Vulcanimicrobiaceae bacterium]
MIAQQAPGATDEQRAAIRFDGGNLYVGAGPGTGKTYLLVERYRHLRARGVAGAKILVLTFSRRAVGELRERLVAAGFAASEIEVRTFHGFAARVIGGGAATFRTGRLLDGFSRSVLLEAAIAQTPTPALSDVARTSRGFARELERTLGDLGRAPEALGPAVVAAASPRLRDVLAIARWSATARVTIGATDIGDLVARAVDEARRPDSLAARFLAGAYAHVLVDEFQDADRVQLDLLAALDATIFAVGDEAQSIYRFRGASDDIVTGALARFAMARFDLTVSRRCPPDVCALASQTPLEGLRPLRSARERGATVEIVRLHAVDDEVFAVADAVEAALEAGVAAAQIAVLVRAFRPLGPLLVDELARRSIAVASTGREELLVDTRVGVLRAALEVFDRPSDAAAWQRFLGASPLRLDTIGLRFAKADLRALRFDAGLASVLEGACRGGTLSGTELAAALSHAYEAWSAGDLGLAARRVVRGLRLARAVLHDEAAANVRAASERLALVCDALSGAQRTARALGAPARPSDLVARFDDDLPALALDDAGLGAAAAGVRVLTVHASKGLEFERVFVADAVDGRFPREARASSFLSDADRSLLASYGVDGPTVAPDGALREEASLWYVALTRTLDRLAISFADQGLDGGPQRPSRFIPHDRLPSAVTRVDREALEIRGVRDGDAALRRDLSASASLQGSPAREAYVRDGDAAFAAFAGTPLRLERSLGVGDAELWLQCPRRLFFKTFARLPDEGERTKLDLGSTIHAVLDRFHERNGSFGPDAIDVERWSRELIELRMQSWNADAYGLPSVARAAAVAADVALRSYARALGKRAEGMTFVVDLRERSLPVPVGTRQLSGRVDRVDLLPDGRRIVVDYKTGAAKKETVAKVASSFVKDWRAADIAGVPRSPLARNAPGELKVQLPFYATAYADVAAIAYVFLGGEADVWRRNGAYFEDLPFTGDLREVTTAALAEIEAGLLEKLDDGSLATLPVTFVAETCTFCPYTAVCPGWSEPEDDA